MQVYLPSWLTFIQFPLALLGTVLFLVFLRLLANFVGEPKLARKAYTILLCGILAMLVLIYPYVGAQWKLPQIQGYVALVLFLFGIILLISYGNLLTYLRKAIAAFLKGSGASLEVETFS